jgi:hypothetical protein
VIGQFRDLDRDDHFVWLRGFADMAARARGLAAFYGGPVWAVHRDAANATMIDSDDVLLLRPAWPGAGLPWRPGARGPASTPTPLAGVMAAFVLPLPAPADAALLDFCREHADAVLRAARVQVLGWLVSEGAPNNFPRLPVREGEPVLAAFALFDDAAALAAFIASAAWTQDLAPAFARRGAGALQIVRLAPTARSALHR